MSRLVIVSIFLFLLSSGVGLCASPIMAAFKEYQSALDVGDIRRAENAGERAWKLAEEVKKYKNAAILAYNLAELRLRYLPDADAIRPARRALELASANNNNMLAPEKARLLTTLIEYKNSSDLTNVDSLQQALIDFDEAGQITDFPAYLSRIYLVDSAVAEDQWNEAVSLAEQILQDYETLGMQDPELKARAHIRLGAALFYQDRTNNKDAAQDQFIAAMELSGKFRYDEVPDLYLQAWAWAGIMNILWRSIDKNHKSRIPDNIASPRAVASGRPEECPEYIKWKRIDPPVFPSKMLEKGYVGLVIVSHDLDVDGRTKNVAVEMEVPGNSFGVFGAFGTSALQAAKKWQADLPENLPSECLSDHYTPVQFVINRKMPVYRNGSRFRN